MFSNNFFEKICKNYIIKINAILINLFFHISVKIAVISDGAFFMFGTDRPANILAKLY